MSGVVDSQQESILLGHKLFNSETEELCTTFLQTLRTGRKSSHLGSSLDWEERQPQRQVQLGEQARWLRTGAGAVRPEDVDWFGRLDLTALIHLTSDANVQFENMIGMTSSYMRRNQVGFSTAEYQLTIHEMPPVSGTSLEAKSALAHIGRTSLWFVHNVYDRDANRKLVTLAQLGVHLDLVSRRPSTIPNEIRERVEALNALQPTQPG